MKSILRFQESIDQELLNEVMESVGCLKVGCETQISMARIMYDNKLFFLMLRDESEEGEDSISIQALTDPAGFHPRVRKPLAPRQLEHVIKKIADADEEARIIGLGMYDGKPDGESGAHIGGNPLNLYTESVFYIALANGDDMVLSMEGDSSYRYHLGKNGRTSHDLGGLSNGINIIDQLHFGMAQLLGQI